ncbi:MAG: hypothetical protein M1818_005587 [Claussenomyces sp. TS43310]|nr:MAG: hypothetical protein M1818_005587 [Claussenomyces sp. TS43310]
MAPNVLARVLNGDSSIPTPYLQIIPARLHDHCRYKVAHADYPGVVPRQGETVRGVYVAGLTSYNMKNLDIFEGEQYVRRRVKVKLLTVEGNIKGEGHVEGEQVGADTYIFVAGEELLEDTEWNFEEFVNEKMYRWADTSHEYADLDNAIDSEDESGHDPTGGRGVRGDMDNKLKGKQKEEVLGSAV